jgi:hypothetical protein
MESHNQHIERCIFCHRFGLYNFRDQSFSNVLAFRSSQILARPLRVEQMATMDKLCILFDSVSGHPICTRSAMEP